MASARAALTAEAAAAAATAAAAAPAGAAGGAQTSPRSHPSVHTPLCTPLPCVHRCAEMNLSVCAATAPLAAGQPVTLVVFNPHHAHYACLSVHTACSHRLFTPSVHR